MVYSRVGMHLDTLRLYCDTVRLRSFSRAAAARGVTQSAASQAIRQLEGQLDVALLDRSRRPLAPTEEGRAFFEACRHLLQGFDKARADLWDEYKKYGDILRRLGMIKK